MTHVARYAFYRWFDETLERCIAALAERALAYARAQKVDLSGTLCGVTDWYIVDATTVTLRDALRKEFPGRGRMRRSRCIKSSPSDAEPSCANISVRPGSMTDGI